jgi:hypothetical protein
VQHDDRVEAQSSPRLACSVLSLAGVRPSLCQEAASEIPPTTVQAAADNPETDKVLAEFSKALDEWTAKIATEEQTIAAPSTSDNELRRIPDLLESLQTLAVRTRSVGEHPTQAQSQGPDLLQPLSLPRPQPGGAVLQQDQAVSAGRDPIRQARRQLPRLRQARLHPPMAARFMSARPNRQNLRSRLTLERT